jgi:hypothetical protein
MFRFLGKWRYDRILHVFCINPKYRRIIFDAEVDTVLKDVCLDIAKRNDIAF